MWFRKSLARIVVGLTAGAVVAALLPTAAFAASSGPTDWVAYGPVPAGGTVQTVQGTSDGNGGCTFNYSASLSPGQTATRADEVSFSPSTCQSQVATSTGATAAPETAAPSNTDSVTSGTVGTQAAAGTSSAPSVALTTFHSAGYWKSWYQDPVGLVVNSVQNSTDWHWNGSCVVAPVSGSFRYTWFSASGWSLQANNWSNTYNCTQSTSSSYAHFHNGIFCAFIATDTYYNRNNVHGRYNGTLTGNVSASKSGGCTSLLSFHTALRRTLN